MIRRICVIVAVCAVGGRALLAQTAWSAQNLVVFVRSQFTCGQRDHPTNEGTATLVRIVGDTIYAVTARHVIEMDGCSANSLTVRYQSRGANAEVIARHEGKLDLAILRAVAPGDEPLTIPKLPRPIIDSSLHLPGASEERAFVLGCPESGTCFERPLAVRLRYSFPPFLRLQAPFIEGGYSGGPVVARNGALIGIVVSSSLDAIVGVRWSEVGSWLAANGIEYQLPEPLPLPPGKTSLTLGFAAGRRTAHEFGGHGIRGYLIFGHEFGGTTIWVGALNLNEGWLEPCRECAGKTTILGSRGFAAAGGIAFRTGGWAAVETEAIPLVLEFRVGAVAASLEHLVEQEISDSTDERSGGPVSQRLITPREIQPGLIVDLSAIAGLTDHLSLHLGLRLLSFGDYLIYGQRSLGGTSVIFGIGMRL